MHVATLDDVLALPSVSYADRQALPHAPGLYFAVVDACRVVYVGMSKISMRQRWWSHHRRRDICALGETTIAWLTVPSSRLLDEWERAAIAAFRPPLNNTGVRPVLSGVSPDLIGPGAMAKDLGLSISTLHEWVRLGRLPVVDVATPGGARHQYRFNRRQVRAELAKVGWHYGQRYPIRHSTIAECAG